MYLKYLKIIPSLTLNFCNIYYIIKLFKNEPQILEECLVHCSAFAHDTSGRSSVAYEQPYTSFMSKSVTWNCFVVLFHTFGILLNTQDTTKLLCLPSKFLNSFLLCFRVKCKTVQ